MTDEQRIVYLEGILLQARITLESMLTANAERIHRGESLAYNQTAILGLIDEFGIHHNALITNIYGRYLNEL